MTTRALWVAVALAACRKEEPPTGETPTDTGTTPGTTPTAFPLPDDLDSIDFEAAFVDAVTRMVTVTAQQPWSGHVRTMDRRATGCPDFYTEPFTVAGQPVGRDDGVSWNDDCVTPGGFAFDGWTWWDSRVAVTGQLDDPYGTGRTTEGLRTIEGNATIETIDGDDRRITFEFDGLASDSLYRVQAAGAYGYEPYDRFVYSSQLDATVTGRDVFAQNSQTPDGYRADLVLTLTGGDVDNFEARGDVYLFSEVLMDRFDSIGVDMELQGPKGAGPDVCTLEPLGWVGLRDENAYWYDVVFLPRFEEDIVDVDFPNDPLSVCDGCGKLYIQGVEQEGKEICIDFSFLFDGTVPLPKAEDYVLPWRSFE